MVSDLHPRLGMRKSIVCALLVFAALPAATAQELDVAAGATVARAEVSGIARGRLSLGLRGDIDELIGTPYSSDTVDMLATRLEQEQPEFVAAVRVVPFGPNGEVEVIFLAARISDDSDLESNINTRYTVESVDLSGVPQGDISPELRADMQALVGERLDPDRADGIERRLEEELPGHKVRRHIERGSARGQIRLFFEVSKAPWIPFDPSRSMIVYHSRQGWGSVFDLGLVARQRHRFTLGAVIWNDDDLIEEYGGYRLAYENRFVGGERFGFRLEFSSYREKWREATLQALASASGAPEAYRNRNAVESAFTFAFSPDLRASVGVGFTGLESQSNSPDSVTANVAAATLSYDRTWNRLGADHSVAADYTVRTATRVLESDLVYTRHLGQLHYAYERGHTGVATDFFAGTITGAAPLFERFSLGSASTLRGWNKFDIAPYGGDNVVYHSLEYRFHGFAVFHDAGAVWNDGDDPRLRLAAGFGYHDSPWPPDSDEAEFSIYVGFPLRAERVRPMFTAKVTF